jgi:hypothetical protein
MPLSASIPPESIQPAFEGIILGHDRQLLEQRNPNVSYLSIVRRIDSERTAATESVLSRTARNISESPQIVVASSILTTCRSMTSRAVSYTLTLRASCSRAFVSSSTLSPRSRG